MLCFFDKFSQNHHGGRTTIMLFSKFTRRVSSARFAQLISEWHLRDGRFPRASVHARLYATCMSLLLEKGLQSSHELTRD